MHLTTSYTTRWDLTLKPQEILAEREFSELGRVGSVLYANIGGTLWPKRGRPTVEINLSTEESATLERWARRHSSSQALALRSKIVLACAVGDRTQVQYAADLGCNPVTVGK